MHLHYRTNVVIPYPSDCTLSANDQQASWERQWVLRLSQPAQTSKEDSVIIWIITDHDDANYIQCNLRINTD